jgi:hypothetical protein
MFSVSFLNPQYEYHIKRKLVLLYLGPTNQFTLCYHTIRRVSSILSSLIFVDFLQCILALYFCMQFHPHPPPSSFSIPRVRIKFSCLIRSPCKLWKLLFLWQIQYYNYNSVRCVAVCADNLKAYSLSNCHMCGGRWWSPTLSRLCELRLAQLCF